MTTVETSLCPGSGRYPTRIMRGPGYRRPYPGICPVCGMAVDLITNPDAGPEGVVDDHGRPGA